jgi:hypothetical protein
MGNSVFCGGVRGAVRSATGRRSKRGLLAAVLLVALLFPACMGERISSGSLRAAAQQTVGSLLFGADCGGFYLNEIAPSITFDLGSTTASETSSLTVDLTIPSEMTTPILTTYQAVITVAPEFTFLGFDALGSGSAVGTWDFDFIGDGDFTGADFTIDHFGIDTDSAYSDSDATGTFSPGIDPTAEYTMGKGGEHIITMILPDGGIEPARGMCSYFSFDARYTLFDGIVRLPATPGNYTVNIMATSYDLTVPGGGPADATPPAPMTYSQNYLITVPEPGRAPLAFAGIGTLMLLSRRRAHSLRVARCSAERR